MKLLILQNNITDKKVLDDGILLLKKYLSSINFPIEINTKITTKKFTSVPFSNNTNKDGYTVNQSEILPFLGDNDCVVLVYDWTKISPQPTNPSENGLAISIPCQWYDKYPEVFAEFALHELCHLMFFKSKQLDTTHDYIPEFSQKPRYEYYLHLLNKKPQNATVTLFRMPNKYETPGQITAYKDGAVFSCKSLELLKCIPKGTYEVKWTWSPRFMKYTYQVMDVKGWTGIRIHSGNYAWGKQVDTEGCILLGSLFQDVNKDGVADVINSRVTTDAFNRFMGGKSFTLQIK